MLYSDAAFEHRLVAFGPLMIRSMFNFDKRTVHVCGENSLFKGPQWLYWHSLSLTLQKDY
jgi:hypothetical protein